MMNLSKLFEMQKELDEHIEKEHPREPGEDRLAKKILSLQVELGELANEWRGFKYWSNDQEPRTVERLTSYYAAQKGLTRNPLLEEYVDCLHFILSIGNDLGIAYINMQWISEKGDYSSEYTIETFAWLFELTAHLEHYKKDKAIAKKTYERLFLTFLALGELEHHLSFTWEQIETAYIQKNNVNHDRQENGY